MSAGPSASIMNLTLSSLHSTTSNFSPLSSLTICLTLEPREPTHAPLGSTFGSLENTAIFVLLPASLAIARNSTVPSVNSGTSNSNILCTNSALFLLTTIGIPFDSVLISVINAFILFPLSRRSKGIRSLDGITASASCKSIIVWLNLGSN